MSRRYKPAQATASLKFFDWAYANGDKAAADLDYVSLPDHAEGPDPRRLEAAIKDTTPASRSADEVDPSDLASLSAPPAAMSGRRPFP